MTTRHRTLPESRRGLRPATRVPLTPWGGIASAWSLCCFALFAMAGWHETLSWGLASAVPVAVAVATVTLHGRAGLTVGLSAPDHATAGEPVTVDAVVCRGGRGRRRSGVDVVIPVASSRRIGGDEEGIDPLRIAMPVDGSGRASRDRHEGGEIRERLRIAAMPRTVLTVGPAMVRHEDPFGLARWDRRLSSTVTVHVRPPVVPLGAAAAGAMRDPDGFPAGMPVADGSEFLELREAGPDDDARRIHWPSTVRTGTPMVRRHEIVRRVDTSLTLDVRRSGFASDDECELAVAVHASLGAHCLTLGRTLTARAGDAHPPQPRHGAACVDAFLDECCSIAFDGPQDGANPRHADPSAAVRLLTVGSATAEEDPCRLGAGGVTFRVGEGDDPGLRRHGSLTIVTVGALADLPRLMEVAAPWTV